MGASSTELTPAGRMLADYAVRIQELHEQANVRVNTARINAVVEKAVSARSPAPMGRRMPKIYYGTQTGVAPPHAGVHADAVPPVATLFVDAPALVPPVEHVRDHRRDEQ